MNKFGLITTRDPNEKYYPMTDVIHEVLNDLTVDDFSIIGGDSHTRMSKSAFGADSGTVALALATEKLLWSFQNRKSNQGTEGAHGFRDVVL